MTQNRPHVVVVGYDLTTEAEPALGARFGVRAIPNFVVVKNGTVVTQHPGLASREEMRRWLENAGA